MTRSEHIEWCKKRALEYVDNDDLTSAFSSMMSDLTKHPETDGHAGAVLGMGLLMIGALDTSEKMRNFIEGFN
jgi:hypothetical protein